MEPEELQRLPPSAVIVSYASGPRRHVVLADANPAIATLSTVTWRSLDQARLATPAAPPGAPPARSDEPVAPPGAPVTQPVGWRSGRGQPPPNLGPPPEPTDWRKRRH